MLNIRQQTAICHISHATNKKRRLYWITTLLFLSYIFDKVLSIDRLPDTSGITHQCGPSFLASAGVNIVKFKKLSLNELITQTSTQFLETTSVSIYRTDGAPKAFEFWGSAACYAPRPTMKNEQQCRICLRILMYRLEEELCINAQNAFLLVADCFLSYSVNDFRTYCSSPPIN